MPVSKIQSESEIVRWIEEGKTYQWMVAEYGRKYNLQVTPSMFGNFRRKQGLDRRIVRDDELLPWYVKPEHRHTGPAAALRAEARRRAGKELTQQAAERAESLKRYLAENGAVVHYDADTEEGWFYVPAREGVDTDLIRVPETKTTLKPARD